MATRSIEILVVEDAPGDIWLIQETLRQGTIRKNIHVVTNGEMAIEFIRRRGLFESAARPDLVLLDLNLPRRDGFEVLKEIKGDPLLRSITVIVLTTSNARSDVNTAYDLNANCYVVKPENLDDFTTALRSIERFWISMASLPTLSPDSPFMETAADSPEDVQTAGGSSQSQSNMAAWAGRSHKLKVGRACSLPHKMRCRMPRRRLECR